MSEARKPGPALRWLERATAGLLLAVVIALVWMLTVANQPDWLRLDGAEVEVLVVVVLLSVALVLVSVVALLHTRQ